MTKTEIKPLKDYISLSVCLSVNPSIHHSNLSISIAFDRCVCVYTYIHRERERRDLARYDPHEHRVNLLTFLIQLYGSRLYRFIDDLWSFINLISSRHVHGVFFPIATFEITCYRIFPNRRPVLGAIQLSPPQGPITMISGKQGVVEFRNPFDKPTDFSLQAGRKSRKTYSLVN